jgi:hypothetical protein
LTGPKNFSRTFPASEFSPQKATFDAAFLPIERENGPEAKRAAEANVSNDFRGKRSDLLEPL